MREFHNSNNSTHLFNTRGVKENGEIDIESNKEKHKYLRELYDHLHGKYINLMAIATVGSTVKGYAEEDSDLDIVFILKEKKDIDIKNFNSVLFYNIYFFNSIKKSKSETVYKIDCIDILFEDFDIDIDLEYDNIPSPNKIYSLIYPTVGDIEYMRKIREKVKNKVANLSDDEKDKWIAEFVDVVMRENYMNFVKKELSRTNPEMMDDEQAQERVLEERRVLVENRLRRMFDVPKKLG